MSPPYGYTWYSSYTVGHRVVVQLRNGDWVHGTVKGEGDSDEVIKRYFVHRDGTPEESTDLYTVNEMRR